jgi:hypothetical protein
MITNKYCELSKLSEEQVEMLRVLMPDSNYFAFGLSHALIGFTHSGSSGTWEQGGGDIVITFMQMVVLLAAEVEGV